jgi:hypothetical protein
MKHRFTLYRRKLGGMFYIQDAESGKQESLGTKDRTEAVSILNARNEAVRQPHLNLQIAKAYLAGTDSGVTNRTWQNALDALIELRTGPTKERWQRATKEKAFDLIRDRVIIETTAEHLFACLKAGTVSTNVHLRELHTLEVFLPSRLRPTHATAKLALREKTLDVQSRWQLQLCSSYHWPSLPSLPSLKTRKHGQNGGERWTLLWPSS